MEKPSSGLLKGMRAGMAVSKALRRARNSMGSGLTKHWLGAQNEGRQRATTTVEAPPRFFSLFKAPRQMQHWGEPQVHPHTNWFDLFFDLIFVGAAFQLGSLLKQNVDAGGCLYFGAIFLSLQGAWSNKLHFDARIDADDIVHKVQDILEAAGVCAAALHIGSGADIATPMQDMQDLNSGHAWGFSLCNVFLRLLTACRWWEVHRARETPGSIAHSRVLAEWKVKTALIYGCAAAFSHAGCVHALGVGDACADVPAILWLLATLYETHSLSLSLFCGRRFPRYLFVFERRTSIPMHIIFSLHRYGEWVMLMVGESVLSLVVGARLDDKLSFYAVFCCGFLSAAALQFMHYSTQPFDPDAHAMRRHTVSGLLWGQTLAFYSAALIAFGVALKVLLSYHSKPYLAAKYGWLTCGSLALCYLLEQFMHALHGGPDQFVVDCGLHASLPTWLFDVSRPHRSMEGAKSCLEIAAAEHSSAAEETQCLRRRRRIAAAKIVLLGALAVLPLARLRALTLSCATAGWCVTVVALEALSRSEATATQHDAHEHHVHEEQQRKGERESAMLSQRLEQQEQQEQQEQELRQQEQSDGVSAGGAVAGMLLNNARGRLSFTLPDTVDDRGSDRAGSAPLDLSRAIQTSTV